MLYRIVLNQNEYAGIIERHKPIRHPSSVKKPILLIFFLIPVLLFAQENKFIIQGKVTDISNSPVAHAAIQNLITGEGVNSDLSGHYYLRTTLPATLKVSLIGYKTVLKKIAFENKKDTVNVDFSLEIDSTQLEAIDIPATNQPELIKESGDLMDFETQDSKLWLLYFSRKGYYLKVYDSGMHFLSQIGLKHGSSKLSKTPHNIIYIENSYSVRFNFIENNNSISYSSLATDNFNSLEKFLIAFSYPNYYYALISYDMASIDYLNYNSATKIKGLLYSFTDNDIAGANDEILEGIDLLPIRILDHVTCFLKIIRDTVYIFNFDNDSMLVYNPYNEKIRQMSLNFHLKKLKYHYQDILVNDEATECYYKFVLHNEVYLEKIDLNTGSKINTQKLSYTFPEKIRIMGGYVYYTISDKDPNKSYIEQLYRQKL